MLPRRGALLALLLAAADCRTAAEPRQVVHNRARRPTTLMLGDSLQLQAAVCSGRQCGPDSTLTLATSDSAVASVSAAGSVYARRLGGATLVLEADRARPDTIAVRVIPRVARIVLAPRRANAARGDTVVFSVRAFDEEGSEISDPPVEFDHATTSGPRGMWSPRIPMVASRPGTYSLVARVGALADTATFIVTKARRPRPRQR